MTKDIFDQVEECGFVATKDGSEVYKVLYVDRGRHFIVTDKEELLKLANGYFWILRQNEKSAYENGLFYFFPHKQKQKYYQWVLVDEEDKCLITHSQNEDGGKIIDNNPGYFTKENPPTNKEFFEKRKYKWIPLLETEKEA